MEDQVLKTSDHSHVPDTRQSEKRVALSEIRMKAVNSNSPARRIIRSTTASMSTTAAVEMANYELLSRNVRRLRSNNNSTPTLPTELAGFVLCDEYTKTIKGEKFLLFDNGDAVNRIMIFATRDNLAFLVHCDDWYMDGTFDVTPPLFKQVYTIHGN